MSDKAVTIARINELHKAASKGDWDDFVSEVFEAWPMLHALMTTPLFVATHDGYLSFAALRIANLSRCPQVFHPLEEWSPQDWACALAGETGETCNKIKKMRRGEDVPIGTIADELADVVCYADLLAARLGIDLGEAVRRKFNAVSNERGSSFYL